MSARAAAAGQDDAVLRQAPRPLLREEQYFLLLAIVIGVYSGLAVVCFRLAIEWTRLWMLGPALTASPLRTLAAPAAAGLLVALLVVRLFPRARGSGVNQTKSAVYIYDGSIPFRTVVGKFITAALAIGSGHSLGPEDPSLQVGAGLASAIGRRLHLSRERVRLIAPLGAAAGLAAAFNSPIAAVLFVIEEVIGRWSAGVLGAVVLSAVSGTVVARWFLGSEPMFRVPAFELRNPAELLAYAALGVVGGLASVVFLKLVLGLRPRLKALPRWTQYLQPAIAGLIVGALGLFAPQVMGAGYEAMDQAMHGQYSWQLLGGLAGLKIAATAASFVSGTPGGLFAPTLFIGAMLGAAVNGVSQQLAPHLTGPIGAYALVGMGTAFAGILRAPMTSVFMVLEVGGNYGIILPVMISNTVAYLISRSLQRTPLFDELSRQDGIDLPSMEELREERTLRVEDAMQPPPSPVLDAGATVDDALKQVAGSSGGFFLVNGAGAWRIVRRPELEQLGASGAAMHKLHTVAGDVLPVVHPDHSLEHALRMMKSGQLLPVVHRASVAQLLGTVSADDILRAYHEAGREIGIED
ncbi:MAG TPA: chloride channel protein [Terriglobales bacterium]|nr:chloride channel protein [Terriglobales bacterium]